MSGKIKSIVGVGFVILVLMSILCTGCGKLTDRIETGAKRILPSYESKAEKSQKIEAEKKRIYASLNKWIDVWAPNESTGFIKLDSLSYNNRFIFSRSGENIWVIKDLPYDKPRGYYSNVYIFHSSDNGSSWEIRWKRPATREWSSIELTKIKIIDEKTVAILLTTSGGPLGMLYTIDGGKTWQIEDKWNPTKIKRLSDKGGMGK